MINVCGKNLLAIARTVKHLLKVRKFRHERKFPFNELKNVNRKFFFSWKLIEMIVKMKTKSFSMWIKSCFCWTCVRSRLCFIQIFLSDCEKLWKENWENVQHIQTIFKWNYLNELFFEKSFRDENFSLICKFAVSMTVHW